MSLVNELTARAKVAPKELTINSSDVWELASHYYSRLPVKFQPSPGLEALYTEFMARTILDGKARFCGINIRVLAG